MSETNKNRKYTIDEILTVIKKTNPADKESIHLRLQSIANALKAKHL